MDHLHIIAALLLVATSCHVLAYDIVEIAEHHDDHHHHHHRPPPPPSHHHHHVVHVVDRHHHSRNSGAPFSPVQPFPHYQCKENGFFRDPLQCKIFYKCVDMTGHRNSFQLFRFKCPENTFYDNKQHKCLPQVNDCKQEIEVNLRLQPQPALIPPILAKPIPGSVYVSDDGNAVQPISSSEANNRCVQSGLFRSPHDCSWFHVCVDVYGNGTMFQLCEYPCPSGTVFSEEKMVCTEPFNAEPCLNQGGPPTTAKPLPTLPPRPVTQPSTPPPTIRPLPPTGRPLLPPTGRPLLPPTGRPLVPPTGRPLVPPTVRPYPPQVLPTLPPNPIPPHEGFICPSNGYFRHETNCSRYFQCINLTIDHTAFQRFEFACGIGTVFDMQFNICNHPHAVPGCGGVIISPPMPPQPATLPPQPVTYPPRPVTLPPQPVTYPPRPVTLPPRPVTLPPRPVTLPPRPVTYPPRPVTYPPVLVDPRPPIPPPKPIVPAEYLPGLICGLNGYLAHPTNCSRFFRCIDAAHIRPNEPIKFEFECAPGTVFDSNLDNCNYIDQVPRCWQSQPPTPVATIKPLPPVTNAPITEKPATPVTYPPRPVTNPPPVTQQPVNPATRPPIPQPIPIIPPEYIPSLICGSEGYLPHPTNCSRFFRCLDAAQLRPNEPIKFEFECAIGTVFDINLNNCNYIDQVPRCYQEPIPPTHRPPVPPPTPIFPIEIIPGIVCNMEGYLAHPTNCSRFFRCLDASQLRPNEPIKYEFECAIGTVFDINLNNCNYIDQVPRCFQPVLPTPVPTGSVEGSTSVIIVTLPPTRPSTDLPIIPAGPIIPPLGPPEGPPCYQPGFFRYPNDCSRFYRCFNLTVDWTKFGKVEFSCGIGTVFDESISVCNHPQLVPGCESIIPFVPIPTHGPEPITTIKPLVPITYPPVHPQPGTYPPVHPQPGTYPPVHPQPGTYPPVHPQPGTYPPVHPQPGTYPPVHPQPGTNPPVHPQPGTYPPTQPQPGPLCSFNGFMRNPLNCSLFYRCVNTSEHNDAFIRYDFVCGPGSVFDLSINVCNHPQHVPDCGGESIVVIPPNPVEPPTRPVEPPIRPVEPPIRPVEPPIRPVEPPIRPVEPPIRPVEPPIRPVEPPTKPVEPPINPVEPPTRPVYPPVEQSTPPSGSQIGTSTQKVITLPPPISPPTGVIVVIIPSPPSSESSLLCQNDGFYRHPSDCARFFRCIYDSHSKQFIRLEFACASGSVYDDKINVCNHISQVPVCFGYKPTTPPCDADKSTEKPIYPSTTTTEKLITYPSTTTTQKPITYPSTTTQKPTTYPSTTTQRPVTYPSTTTYKPVTYPSSTTYKPVTHPTFGPTPGPITPPCNIEGYFRHPTNCSQFFRCVDLTGTGSRFQKIHFNCPPGTAFDDSISACNFPHLVQGCAGHIIVIPPPSTIRPPVGVSTTQPPIIVEWSTANPTTKQPEVTQPSTPIIVEWSTVNPTTKQPEVTQPSTPIIVQWTTTYPSIPEITTHSGSSTPLIVEWSTKPSTQLPEITLGPSTPLYHSTTYPPIPSEASTTEAEKLPSSTTYKPLLTNPTTEQVVQTTSSIASTEPSSVPTAPSEISTESSTIKLTTELPFEPTTIQPVPQKPGYVCVAGGKFSHESDCSKFYLCQDLFGDGFQFHLCIVECPVGTHFDPRSGFCSQWVASTACLAPLPNLPNPNWAYHHYTQYHLVPSTPNRLPYSPPPPPVIPPYNPVPYYPIPHQPLPVKTPAPTKRVKPTLKPKTTLPPHNDDASGYGKK